MKGSWPEDSSAGRWEDVMLVLEEGSESPGQAMVRQQAPSSLQPAKKSRRGIRT